MKKYLIGIISLLFCFQTESFAQTWREMPYYLKGYEAEYKRSAREAALAGGFGLVQGCPLWLVCPLGAGHVVRTRRMGDV